MEREIINYQEIEKIHQEKLRKFNEISEKIQIVR